MIPRKSWWYLVMDHPYGVGRKAERKHGHPDKEALVVVFAVKKFHKFCMAVILRFTQITNHFWGCYTPKKSSL